MRIDPAKVYIFLSAKRNDSACRMPAWVRPRGHGVESTWLVHVAQVAEVGRLVCAVA